jgi:hypothetical protein
LSAAEITLDHPYGVPSGFRDRLRITDITIANTGKPSSFTVNGNSCPIG